MKSFLIFAIAGVATAVYLHGSPSPNVVPPAKAPENRTAPAAPVASSNAAPAVVVSNPVSPYHRWKTGPDAQTRFEEFAPDEQAHWNDNCGYTIVSGPFLSRH